MSIPTNHSLSSAGSSPQQLKAALGILLISILFFWTQWYEFAAVPGFHFDEAWQYLFAHRIATEPGFWPLQAMNAYTSPIIHYGLALWFRLSGSPTLESGRIFFGIMPVVGTVIFTLVTWLVYNGRTAIWLLLILSLHPASIHSRRFAIEMNGFYWLCFAVSFAAGIDWCRGTGSSRFKSAIKLFSFIIFTVLGSYSHILFMSWLWTVCLLAITKSKLRLGAYEWRLPSWVLIATLGLTLPLLIRVVSANPRPSSWSILIFHVLISMALLKRTTLPQRLHQGASQVVLLAGCVYFLFFSLLFWNGFWPYAQVTGNTHWLFGIQGIAVPFNLLLLAAPLWLFWNRTKNWKPMNPTTWPALGQIFLLDFVLNSALLIKQAPRFYTVPFLLFSLGIAACLSKIPRKVQALAFCGFLIWNSLGFQYTYLNRFLDAPPTSALFHAGPFKDSAKDFRPLQTILKDIHSMGCLAPNLWVENDRFLLPMRFLEITSPPTSKTCPWPTDKLYFGTWPTEHDFGVRPVWHSPAWGDVFLGMRPPQRPSKDGTSD